MVGAQVMGNHTTITVGGLGSYLELNVMMPVMAHALLQSIELLASTARVFAEKCIDGITVNEERATELMERNPALATALAPRIGYDLAATIAKESFKRKTTAREIAYELSGLSRSEVDEIMDAREMTHPGIPGGVILPGGG